MLVGHLVGLGREPRTACDLGAIPPLRDVMSLELPLEREVAVQQVRRILVRCIRGEARCQRESILVGLHRELERDGPTQDFTELMVLEKGLDVGPRSSADVRARRQEGAGVAAELAENKRLREVLELCVDRPVGRVPKVVLALSVQVLLVAVRVHIQAVGVDGVVLILKLARQIFHDRTAARVRSGVEEGHSPHGRPAVGLVPVDVPRQGLDAREGCPALGICNCHLVGDCEHQRVVVLAELLYDELRAREHIGADVAVAFDVRCVAGGAGHARRQVAPVVPGQRHDHVEAQLGSFCHEIRVRDVGVDVVEPNGIRTHVGYRVQSLHPERLHRRLSGIFCVV
mmetsp:Transcript_6820/g.20692  ORF Transcript_6820/g.20692 Transcript_6820/m.20692 type:complete len:342 (+) Transcript_6820:266-1291(+)